MSLDRVREAVTGAAIVTGYGGILLPVRVRRIVSQGQTLTADRVQRIGSGAFAVSLWAWWFV